MRSGHGSGRLLPSWALLLSLASCHRAATPPAAAPSMPPRASALGFTEIAHEAGLDFVHANGAFGQKWLPETMGSGCAWIDYDGDGDPDALLLSGADWPGHPTGGRKGPALFRNDGGRFTDVTEAAGLGVPMHAMGATFADCDGDGDEDLFVSAVGQDRLFRNDGGAFTDVTEQAGLGGEDGFSTSCAWLDFDRDGDSDLLVLDYVAWTPESDLFCSLDGENKSYCTPETYPGTSPRLLRNDGDGRRFTNVTVASGLHRDDGKGLGVAVLDADGDGWDDVFVANDTQPNFLFVSQGGGRFREQGVLAGVAFDDAGRTRGAMGVDAGDFDHSGRPGLVIGNFSYEMISLYRNDGETRFADVAPASAMGPASLPTLAFGIFFFDADLDGWPDVFVANGHVETDVARMQPGITYAQPPHLFRNLGGDAFMDVAPSIPALSAPMVARGAAFADFDGDGDLDVLVNAAGDRARLFRNDGPTGRALRVRLVGGAGSSPDAWGARVDVEAAGLHQTQWLRSGHSYCSQSEDVLTFGLGPATSAESVTVTWPSRRVSRMTQVPAGAITVREANATK